MRAASVMPTPGISSQASQKSAAASSSAAPANRWLNADSCRFEKRKRSGRRVYLIPPAASGYGRRVRANQLRTLLIALLAAIAAILWFRWQAGPAAEHRGGVAPAGEMPKPRPTVE